MNVWNIAGRIGKDAVTRHTSSGNSVTGFSVAVDQRKGGEKTTLWVDCGMWGERGEKVAPYLLKGTTVAVSGEAGAREHEGKVYMTLNVRELTLLGGKSEGDKQAAPKPARGAANRPAGNPPADDIGDDDIPF